MSEASKTIDGSHLRLDFIQSLFPATWTINEIIEVERLVFYFVFMVSSAISAAFFHNEDGKTIAGLKLIQDNAKKINELSKKVHEKVKDDKFFRKPLGTASPPMAKVMTEHNKEVIIETKAALAGVSKDQQKWRDRLKSIPIYLILLVFLYFVGKNQVYPYVSRRYNKVILD